MSKKFTLSIICSLFVFAAFSQSSTFKDLWGIDAKYLGKEMSKNGYYHIKTKTSGYSTYNYWWNSSKKKCISSLTNNGKVQSIINTSVYDCNKSNNDSHYNKHKFSHSGHHSNFDENHMNNESLKLAFDRGYKDGLHHVSYHNIYQRNSSKYEEYSKGYERGVEQRKENTNYHSGKGGHYAHVEVSDLNFQDAKFAYSELKNRNFVEQKKHTDGDTTYRIFYNAKTKQCIKTTSKNKRIVKIQNSTHCF